MSDFRSALKQHFWCGGSAGKCSFRTKENAVEMQALSAPALSKLTDKLALETTSTDPKTDLNISDPKSFTDLTSSDPKSFAEIS